MSTTQIDQARYAALEDKARRSVVHEAMPFARAATPAAGPGRLRVCLITAGVGSCGYYSPDVLEAAAKARVFHAGLKNYIDHPGVAEQYDRPERSVRDVASVLTTDAEYDPTTQGLYAEVEVFSAWRYALAEMADAIGMSIRAYATAEDGEHDGKRMPIVGEITEALSVDYVTDAGRGGHIVEVIESARSIERALTHGVAEATANDARERLQDLVATAYRVQDHQYAWVRDFDADNVWFEMSGDTNGTFQQGYATDTDGLPTGLIGDPVEVRVQTVYVPVGEAQAPAEPPVASEAAPTDVPDDPAGQTTTQEDTMPQIEEARLRQLEEAHGRVPALESERDAAVKRAEEAEARAQQAEAATYARDFARTIVTKANAELAEASVARIVRDALRGDLPLTEAGRLDTEAFTPVVEKARTEEEAYLAAVAEASGIGSVRGVGPTVTADEDLSDAQLDEALAQLTGRTIKEA